ncbi:MAG: hypothetical protein ACKO4T_09675 [Planctomycetaceae bacterium]
MRLVALALSFVAATCLVAAPFAVARAAVVDVAALIGQLGDDDYAVREAAAEQLATLGPEAADALLSAAESTADLEVALRARWLVEALPLASTADPPAVAAILDRYSRGDVDTRVQLMHRLLRLDDDAGIEPLARIVRQERSAAGSRIAAALLAREWHHDDPAWGFLAVRITPGIGPGVRPTARLLRALAGPISPAAIDEAVAAVRLLERPDAGGPRGAADDDAVADEKTSRIFRRVLVELLASAGRREEAVAEAAALVAACRGSTAEEDLLATELAWLTDHGLPEAAGLVTDRTTAATGEAFFPLVAYAAAVAQRRIGDEAAAAALAGRAAEAFADAEMDLGRRLQAAMLLARWGADEWALAEYRGIVDAPAAKGDDRCLAAILAAEFLHDHGRDAEAAAMMQLVLDSRAADSDQILLRLDRDPKAMRSRMLYFLACDAAARGDAAAHRERLEESLTAHGRDVDSLIAWHRLAADDPGRREEAARRVARAVEELDEFVLATPDDPNSYNEYAWLVANTEGDVQKAVRYSKRSLELSFDSASYLDTLAHCRAAAGDAAGAYRTQLLAAGHEPHNVTIRRNLQRFRAALQPQP